MRILYVSFESPLQPFGGIGTYIKYAAEAMRSAGHEVYLFTWAYNKEHTTADTAPFTNESLYVFQADGANIWKRYPFGPYNIALSNAISDAIRQKVSEWNIDVVEATDYLAPALTYFQAVQASGECRPLCVTYNHGFIDTLYETDQIYTTLSAQTELVAERQQCRASDIVIAPSKGSVKRLSSFGIVHNVSLVREPYKFEACANATSVKPLVTYYGRISIAKGADKVVLISNILDSIEELKGLTFIGRCGPTSFRQSDIKLYIESRLNLRLRNVLNFTGALTRDAAFSMLTAGSFGPSLGSAETYSYSCIETIDRGLLPIVQHGTAMAEFIPPDYQGYILDRDGSTERSIRSKLERIYSNGAKFVSDTQQFNKEHLDPVNVASQMGSVYEAATHAKRGVKKFFVRKKATVDDVTILLPVYRPDDIFVETIDSIAYQTSGVPNVIICNDGTPEGQSEYFDYAMHRLPHSKIFRQQNTGLLGSRNALISKCSTKFSLFLDADDILHPDYINRTLAAFNETDTRTNAVFSYRRNFDESDELILRDYTSDHVHFIRNDLRMTALIETKVLRQIMFDIFRRNGEGDDWIFWLAFHAAGYRSMILPEVLFYYRSRSGSMSWPWSDGQAVGTHTMLRETGVELARRRPMQGHLIARALEALQNLKRD